MASKSWFNQFGCIKDNKQLEFEKLAKEMSELLKNYEGQMSYRDLYEVAHQASQEAVGRLVRNHVNSKA